MPIQLAPIAATAANTALGLALGKHNDKRQLRQQRKLQALQIEGQKEMTDYQKAADLDMWHKTGYEAQKEQLKAAGLNAGLLYGMGGAGGQTVGGSGGGIQGATASQAGGNEIPQTAAMGLQLQSQQAQIDLIKAQTEKTKTESENIKGPQTELQKANTASLIEGINNQKSVQKLTEANTALAELEAKWQTASWKTREKILMLESQKMIEEYEMLSRDNMISRETAEQRIEIVQNQAMQIMLQNEAIKTGIKLDEARITEIAQNIRTQIKQLQQGDRQLDQKDKELIIQEIRNDLIETGIWVGAASNIAGTAVDIFTKGKGGKSFTTNNNIYTRPVVEKKTP